MSKTLPDTKALWKAYFVASASVIGISALYLTIDHPSGLVAYLKGFAIIALPQIWSAARIFAIANKERGSSPKAIRIVFGKFGLCAVGFALVFANHETDPDAVFLGFCLGMIGFTLSHIWFALNVQS